MVLFKRYFAMFYLIYVIFLFFILFSLIETHVNAKKENFFRLRLRFYAWKEFTRQYPCITMVFNEERTKNKTFVPGWA